MRQVLFVFAIVTAVMLGLGAAPALAQTRVFVSGHGDDGNPCSLSAPCRSFQAAATTVSPGGEIVALDAAGYGPLIITKAVTVSAIGIEASITSNSATGAALSINAGANDTVTIRGLTIIAGTLANDGIDINAAKSVTIRDTSITGFPAQGVNITPSAGLNVELRGVTATGNGNGGLLIFPSGSGAVTVLADDSAFNGNGGGIGIVGTAWTGTITATLNATTSANRTQGVQVLSVAGLAQPVVMVTGSKLANNRAQGLSGNGNVKVLIDRTQISGNGGNGWEAVSGAVVKSYTNNEVNGNGDDTLNGVTQISSE